MTEMGHKIDMEVVRSMLMTLSARDLSEDDYYTSDIRECYHLKKMIEGSWAC